jgi:hypothetical protein
MMRRLLLISILLLAASSYSQTAKPDAQHNDRELKRLNLVSELQTLAGDSLNIEAPLARALAQAEIAEAAWLADREWAKTLLRSAFDLTFPSEEQIAKVRVKRAGTPPVPPTVEDRARNVVRRRILQIANRDSSFGKELIQLSSEKLGVYEEQLRYAELADHALENGKKDAAVEYILKALQADPTQATTMQTINELARSDRRRADWLILQYISLLQSFPVSFDDQSDIRTIFMLFRVVFPDQPEILPPGPAVMRAYVVYILDRVGRVNAADLPRSRLLLLSAWGPLKQYAPELTEAFLNLEARSRRPGETVPLPETSLHDYYKKKQEAQIKDAIDSEQSSEQVINAAISREDFERARKLISKLKDDSQKARLTETVNLREAMSLCHKGDLPAAETLADRLTKAASILQVYPLLIEKHSARKDEIHASNLVSYALKKLRNADTNPSPLPQGLPSSAGLTSREFDPVLSSLSKFVKAIAVTNELLALEVLDELVNVANRSEVDTSLGRPGFDSDIFTILAPKDEARTEVAALAFKDRLRRIVSRARVYQWRVSQLLKDAGRETGVPRKAQPMDSPAESQAHLFNLSLS